MSCSARLAFACRLLGSLFRTLAVLCTQQRWPRVLGHTLYGAFDVKLYFQALHRYRAPSFSRVVVSSCPETGSDGPHTSGGIGSGRAKAHCDDRREASPPARVLAPT